MRPNPSPTRRGPAALAVLAAALLACGSPDSGPIRVSPEAPLPATGQDDRPPPEGAGPPASAGGAALGTHGGGLLLARPRGGGLAVERIARGEISAVGAKGRGPGDLLLGTADGAVLSAACEPAGIHAQATHPPGAG